MGANDGGDAPVEIEAQRLLFGGGFAVGVHQHDFDFGREAFQQAVGGAEGAVERGHEDPALDVQHRVGDAAAGLAEIDSAAGVGAGVVGRAEQAAPGGALLKEREDFLAVEDVVAAGEDVNAGVEQLLHQRGRDAVAGGGVLAVGDDEVGGVLGGELLRLLAHDAAARAAENVTDKKNVHGEPGSVTQGSFRVAGAAGITGKKNELRPRAPWDTRQA